MTKRNTAYDMRAEQLSLPFMHSPSFELPAGSFRRTESVQEAIRATLKDCQKRGLTREIIADELSRLLSEKVTLNHIANWAAESKNGYRLPLEWAAAFCVVTNDNRVIKTALRESGINVLDDSEMVFFDIGKAIEEKRESDARIKEGRNRIKELKIQGKI